MDSKIEKYRISFCITCMNRLKHLAKTLPKNIIHNENYLNLEFVLLDYNSSDSLESYIHNKYGELVASGRLVYYKTFTPAYFNRSHSRNVAFKLATGDIICNIDADNYTGPGFAAYVARVFERNENVFLNVSHRLSSNDVLGRICVKKQDFYEIRGYDEKMSCYGFEDYDFACRLKSINIKRKSITNKIYLAAISHSKYLRIVNEYFISNIWKVFEKQYSSDRLEFLFFFRDRTFKLGTLIQHNNSVFAGEISDLTRIQLKYTNILLNDHWVDGTWESQGDILLLYIGGIFFKELMLKLNKNEVMGVSKNDLDFSEIINLSKRNKAIMRLSQITNRTIYYENKLDEKITVNEFDFGKEIVFKNFNYESAIVT